MTIRRLTLLLTLNIATLTVLTVKGQQLYKCDATKSFWMFTKDSSFFAVKVLGDAKQTDRKNVISVGNYVLQNILIDKAKFMKHEDNTDLKVLIRYAMSEAEYFTGVFKTKINIQMQQAPLSANKSVLIWFFEMPSGNNQEVKFQLFANIIIEDKIFGLASSQFADQKFDSIKNFLMDVISSLKKIGAKHDFGELCEQ